MIVGRLIGAIILLVGLGVLVRDLLVLIDTGSWAPLSFGQWWLDFDRPGLAIARAAVERTLGPALWDPIITALLLLWASLTLIVLGILILLLSRPRRRARRRFA
jgi:hypothetical protein